MYPATHDIPVCHIADDQGAQEETYIHTGLEKVQSPGGTTYQVKLQEEAWSAGEAQGCGSSTVDCEGSIEDNDPDPPHQPCNKQFCGIMMLQTSTQAGWRQT